MAFIEIRIKRMIWIKLDIDKNQVVYKSVIENEAKIWLEPCFVSENLAALCNRYTSSVTLHDMRTSNPCSTISYGKNLLS